MKLDIFVILAASFLTYAALHDLAARTVPNWLPLCLLVLGCAWRLNDHSLRAGLAVAGGTFAALYALWVLGVMGGGDVKLWAATSLLIPPNFKTESTFFLYVFLLGGALALLYLLLWLCLPRLLPARLLGYSVQRPILFKRMLRAEIWRINRRGPLPYACAISGSAIIILLPLSLQH